MNTKIALIISVVTASILLINCGEEHTYQKAVKNDDIQSFESYLTSYPDGKYVKEAKIRVEFLKYEQAKMAATEESYKRFLDEYPEGKYSKEINDLLYPFKKEYKGHIYTIASIEKKDKWRSGDVNITPKRTNDILFIIRVFRNMPILKEEFMRALELDLPEKKWLSKEANVLKHFSPKYILTDEKKYEVHEIGYQILPENDKFFLVLLIFFSTPKNAEPTEFVMGDLKYDLSKLEIGKNYK